MKAFTQTTIIIVLASTALVAPGSGQPAPSTSGANVRQTQAMPATVPVSEPGRSVNTVAIDRTSRRGQSVAGGVLVIPSTEMKAEDMAAIMEDMTIMSRILDRSLSQQGLLPTSTTRTSFLLHSDDTLLPWSFSQQSSVTEALYLEGFGSLFLIGVDFPLSPLPQDKTNEAEQQGTDQLWRDTWVEVYRPEEAAARKKTQPERQYDAAKVEDLQTTLIKTLKHTANIRALKANESVTLVVRSSAPAVFITGTVVTQTHAGTSDVGTTRLTLPAEAGSGQATFLTIRAKKSDIDSFAKDQLNYDQFRQKVQTVKY